MPIFSRRTGRTDATQEATEQVVFSGGGAMTAIASALALLFSAISLYETVLRRPELSVYVPPVIHYTRENGGEVFAIPVTIANRGARDGTVLSLEVSAKSKSRPDGKTFYSAYTVKSGYFDRSRLERSATGGLTISKQRPKLPFAPLSIAGRENYSGTLLFVAKDSEYPMLVAEDCEIELTLVAVSRFDDMGWLDAWWRPEMKPLSFKVKAGNFSKSVVDRGDTVSLKSAAW
ncbi:MAG: hypothetical protein RLZ98_858 [Pseudomonadota bacterium]|jgi:hypothetical protein